MSAGQEIPLDEEVAAVEYLEALSSAGFTIRDLDAASRFAISPITRVLLASIIEQAIGMPLLDIYTEIDCAVQEGFSESREGVTHQECQKSLAEIFAWTQEKTTSFEQHEVLSRFNKVLAMVYHDYECPCGAVEGDGFVTWRELSVHAAGFMRASRISLSSMVELIRFLRKRPYLNCTLSTKRGVDRATVEAEDQTLEAFDAKLEKARRLFPIIDTLADPAILIIEPVAGVSAPPEVAELLSKIASATVPPFPSGVLPVQVKDPAGPPGATFANVFRSYNYDEAQTFAVILRTALADANNKGGTGPPTRVLVAHTGAAGFRVY